MTSDREFAEYLRSLPRTLSADKVEEIEHSRDVERGQYVPTSQVDHHEFGESRH